MNSNRYAGFSSYTCTLRDGTDLYCRPGPFHFLAYTRPNHSPQRSSLQGEYGLYSWRLHIRSRSISRSIDCYTLPGRVPRPFWRLRPKGPMMARLLLQLLVTTWRSWSRQRRRWGRLPARGGWVPGQTTPGPVAEQVAPGPTVPGGCSPRASRRTVPQQLGGAEALRHPPRRRCCCSGTHRPLRGVARRAA